MIGFSKTMGTIYAAVGLIAKPSRIRSGARIACEDAHGIRTTAIALVDVTVMRQPSPSGRPPADQLTTALKTGASGGETTATPSPTPVGLIARDA